MRRLPGLRMIAPPGATEGKAAMTTVTEMGTNDPITRLTAKERDVLALVAEGYSNDRIAQQLAVTARTVETHTSRIFAKLDLEADQATHRRVLAALAYLNIHAPVSLWLETSTSRATARKA